MCIRDRGEVIFSSEKYKGSTFGFSCAFKKAHEKNKDELILHSSDKSKDNDNDNEKTANKNRLIGLNILVVDDNLINVEVAKSLLEDLGAEVEIAYGGQEAVDIAKSKQFDVILMDIQMPNMDGIEAIQLISKLTDNQYCFKVALTANVMEKDVKRYLTSGFDHVVAKPFNVTELAGSILEYSIKVTH